MRPRLHSILFLGAGLAVHGVAGLSLAGPLDPTLIPSEARWAAHLDMEGAMASKIGAHMRTMVPKELAGSLAQFSSDFGIDPFTDVRDITVFGTGPGESKGAAIALVSPAADRLAANLAKVPLKDFKSVPVGDSTIMSWIDHGREWHVAVTALDATTRAVVFADTVGELETALKLVGNKRSGSNATGLTITDRTPRAGSLLFAAMREIVSGPESEPQAQVLRAAKAMCLDVGEANVEGTARLFADLTMQASTEADANTMREMFQGMIAMSRLGARADAELGKMIDEMAGAVKLSTQGTTFKLSADHPSAAVIEALKLMDARAERAEREGRPELTIGVTVPDKSGKDAKAGPAKTEPAKEPR